MLNKRFPKNENPKKYYANVREIDFEEFDKTEIYIGNSCHLYGQVAEDDFWLPCSFVGISTSIRGSNISNKPI